MEYRRLGKSGVKISSLALGTMTFGQEADEAECARIYSAARDAGINVFDCADVYAGGESERILGRLSSAHRHEVLLTTKAYFPAGPPGTNDRGSSRYRLTKSVEKSLRALGTDYIDIYYLHHFDRDTPIEESLFTLDAFVRQGKILYLGLSNHAAWQVMKTISVAAREGFAPITVIQPMYSLLKRQCEVELLPMAVSEGLGAMSYSPLGGGLLTGKYRGDGKGRFDENAMYRKRYADPANSVAVDAFVALAAERGYNPVSLAIAWVAAHPGITAPLIGARNSGQVKSALGALDIDMTNELRAEISALTREPAPATDRSEG